MRCSAITYSPDSMFDLDPAAVLYPKLCSDHAGTCRTRMGYKGRYDASHESLLPSREKILEIVRFRLSCKLCLPSVQENPERLAHQD